jgi:hypothetical protein
MPIDRLIWLIGLALGAFCAGFAGWASQSVGLPFLALAVCLCVTGLVAEITRALRRGVPAGERPSVVPPANALVERLNVLGARSTPNPHHPGFGRFLALDEAPELNDPRTEAGPRLLGRVAIFSIFIGRYGASWSDLEIARAHDAIIKAGNWLQKEALRWSAPVRIGIADTYFAVEDPTVEDVEVAFVPEGDHASPLEAHAVPKALASFSKAAALAGFADAAEMIERVGPRVSAEYRVWLLHPRAAGRSLAVPLADTPWPGVSAALCYASEANFPEPLSGPPFSDPVTFAHEFLHLFGATDKYEVPLSRQPRGEVTDRDIMCLYHNRLHRMRIDLATAREIGWE